MVYPVVGGSRFVSSAEIAKHAMAPYAVPVNAESDVCACGHVRIGHGDRAVGGCCIGETADIRVGFATYEVQPGVYCQCQGFRAESHEEEEA